MYLYISLILTSLWLTGCGKQIQDFVRDAHPPALVPITSINSTKALKISPGHINSVGTQVGASMTITATNRALSGSQVHAKVSLHQIRTN